jgi:hypothetical protein
MQSVLTPEGTVTITSDLPPVAEPSIYTEGPTTILRVGRLEIVIDPEERAQPEAA